jgi:hypothetical protein
LSEQETTPPSATSNEITPPGRTWNSRMCRMGAFALVRSSCRKEPPAAARNLAGICASRSSATPH